MDDRRVISGIVHVLRSGGRWTNAPREVYGPGKNVYYRALTNRCCRPLAFLLTGGQVADCKAGPMLLERLPACRIMLADKGYDGDAIRPQIGATGAATINPAKVNRRWTSCFSPVHNPRPRCHQADFRPPQGLPPHRHSVHDRLAPNYLAVIRLAATVSYRL